MTWQTHAVYNQFDELSDYDLFSTDPALVAAVRAAERFAAGSTARAPRWAAPRASAGRRGQCQRPALEAFDRRGRRIDQVVFHPSWHELIAK